jgi:hypothetical protein
VKQNLTLQKPKVWVQIQSGYIYFSQQINSARMRKEVSLYTLAFGFSAKSSFYFMYVSISNSHAKHWKDDQVQTVVLLQHIRKW